MRRGLLAWDRDEVPESVLAARLARCQEAMRGAGLDALVLYTNFPRPAAVSYLTHFVPYWSQGLLLVRPAGLPTLVISLSKRVAGWIEETSRLGDIVCTPRLGAEAASLMASAGVRRVGVLELAKLPGGIARPLIDGLPECAVEDASGLFRAVRHPADEAEIALSSKAAAMAEQALDWAVEESPRETAELIGGIESRARLDGAEEVQVYVAPDLAADARLRRMEGAAALGDRYAVQASVAYKGHWVRLGRSIETANGETVGSDMLERLDRLGDGRDAASVLSGLESWTAEACVGSAPLSVLTGHERLGGPLPAGAVVNLTATAERGGAPCFVSAPVVLAREPEGKARPLTGN